MTNTEYLKQMGAKIRKARQAKGIYLRDLGAMCDIHFGAISEIETGKRNAHVLTLKNLADKLGVDVKDFL
ncbi:MAG: helix-turn-helix transcriptional regulator [Ferruginibacter sp.]